LAFYDALLFKNQQCVHQKNMLKGTRLGSESSMDYLAGPFGASLVAS